MIALRFYPNLMRDKFILGFLRLEILWSERVVEDEVRLLTTTIVQVSCGGLGIAGKIMGRRSWKLPHQNWVARPQRHALVIMAYRHLTKLK